MKHAAGFDETSLDLIHGMYLQGGCMAFALALNRRTGWPLLIYEDDEGLLVHAGCRTPSGKAFDVRGEIDDAVFVDRFARTGCRLSSWTVDRLSGAYPQAERLLRRADRHIEMLHPELPGTSSEAARLSRFTTDLTELCRRHGVFLFGQTAYTVGLYDQTGDHASYDAVLDDTAGVWLARSLLPEPSEISSESER